MGESVRLLGDPNRESSSAVAAGIINPVTGRWMTKTWNFDHFMPEARSLYREIEASLDISIFHQIPARRFCLNSEDAKRANRRIRNPRYANVLGNFIPPGENPISIEDQFGSFEIKNAAYVDLPELLKQLHAHFAAQGVYSEASFTHENLEPQGALWHYENYSTQRVIFCEGAALRSNPWFQYLPLVPIKGETLLLQSDAVKLSPGVYHHEKWLLPYGDGTFRIGATYDENNTDTSPTDAARAQLIEASKVFANGTALFGPAKQLAGIRPTTSDNRPFVGSHPKKTGLYVFNGLGSKGASVAPSLSKDFIDHLIKDTPLSPEVDIRRFEATEPPCA